MSAAIGGRAGHRGRRKRKVQCNVSCNTGLTRTTNLNAASNTNTSSPPSMLGTLADRRTLRGPGWDTTRDDRCSTPSAEVLDRVPHSTAPCALSLLIETTYTNITQTSHKHHTNIAHKHVTKFYKNVIKMLPTCHQYVFKCY
jgi:hypothetical protein